MRLEGRGRTEMAWGGLIRTPLRGGGAAAYPVGRIPQVGVHGDQGRVGSLWQGVLGRQEGLVES